MATQPIDYTALAKQAGAISSTPPPGKIDYMALAKQAGAISSTPAPATPPAAVTSPPAAPQQGFLGSFADSSGLSALGDAIMHPFDTAKNIAGALNPNNIGNDAADNNPILKGIGDQITSTVGNAKQAVQYAKLKNLPGAVTSAVSAIPVLGPTMDKAVDQYADKNYAGEMGTLGGLTAATVAPKMLEGAPAALKNVVRGPVDAPIVGSNLTPAARFASAQRLGVNLDAADATNSTLLKGVKKLNENSLLGGSSYEKLGAANTAALQGSTDSFLNTMYPGDRESGGAAIQSALKDNRAGLQSQATTGFDSLPQNVPIPGAEEVGRTAQEIAGENSAYQSMFPSLKPSKAMNVVGDVSGLGPQPAPPMRLSPFVDVSGKPIASSFTPPPTQPTTFGTMQQLRSDLQDVYRNNPDIVQNQGNGFLQRLAGQTDDAMTNASSGLTPPQLQTFRDSNAAWKDMKQTYDDPSSPFYHAVRTDTPSTLYSGIGSKTPEMARNLQNRLGTAIQPLRRGTVEGALKTNADGSPNFKTFGTQLNRIPADYRAELFSPDQNRTLQDVANTSNVMKMDANPSGSGKLAQQVFEGTQLAAAPFHPLSAVEPLLQYPVAKMMTSPKAVSWLMAPAAKPNPFLAPAATAAAVTASKKTSLYGERR